MRVAGTSGVGKRSCIDIHSWRGRQTEKEDTRGWKAGGERGEQGYRTGMDRRGIDKMVSAQRTVLGETLKEERRAARTMDAATPS